MESFGLRATIREKCVETSLKDLKRILFQFEKGAENKYIPKKILRSSRVYLKELFEGLMRGDGTKTKNGGVYYTKSKKLSENMCELGLKLGYAVRICERETLNPKKTKKSKSYIVRIRKVKGTLQINQIKEVNYEGKVWCLKTKNGNFFIERDTKIACSGNSMNIVGERQYPEKFVPKTVKALLENKKVTLHGKGKDDLSSRCWIHARNVADALLFLLEKGEEKETYNIVGEERTVLEIANWICEVIKGRKLKDEEIEFIDYHSARPGHDKRYALSGEKLAKMGWVPPKGLEESLKKTVQWMISPENQKWVNL